MVTCMATQMPTSRKTVAIRIFRLIVFHLSRWPHPRPPAGGVAAPSSSRAVYLKSEALKRSDRFEGTRGMIFGKYTIVQGVKGRRETRNGETRGERERKRQTAMGAERVLSVVVLARLPSEGQTIRL